MVASQVVRYARAGPSSWLIGIGANLVAMTTIGFPHRRHTIWGLRGVFSCDAGRQRSKYRSNAMSFLQLEWRNP